MPPPPADRLASPDRLRTVAVVLAGGVGARMGASMPKQLLRIAGKTVIEHTIAALDASPDVDEVLVMMEPDHLESIEAIRAAGTYGKLTRVLPGGETRNRTTALALAAIPDGEAKVLLHDAVRPFVDQRIVHECVVALDAFDAVDTAIPSADTIIRVATDEEGREFIRKVPKRARLRRGQTPQAFRLSVIREAYSRAARDPDFTATDDCTVVLRYLPEVPIAVVAGSDENMKITEPVDISFADKLFQLRTAIAGALDDAGRRRALEGTTLVVFGGSEGIGQAVCRLAESYGARVFSFSRTETDTHIERREDIAAALRAAAEATGRIDYVVNTAAVLEVRPLSEVDASEVRSTIDINLMGPILLAQEALPHLRKQGGHLLYFTSSSYTRGRAGYSLYSASKAGLVNFTQALAEEWDEEGVRVNCISPQRTRTGMRQRPSATRTRRPC
ncbi:bifunctional cytidylyltransferase/SDR family oxidoreductase [Naasia aerilata]|uniref:2-C-methyl-D-erythritol 4-phosphate cytidylyltransferase n=1 Tax=Naasia aerilata TaxID=1162966 RepID=A0ABN6XQG5_9MICO|nr:bifunctional cytidylyltransferase/SDR family oxidoreductase [Naasia aerilata]BDZ45916.1 pyrophosphorylase [Naasia aerilata]